MYWKKQRERSTSSCSRGRKIAAKNKWRDKMQHSTGAGDREHIWTNMKAVWVVDRNSAVVNTWWHRWPAFWDIRPIGHWFLFHFMWAMGKVGTSEKWEFCENCAVLDNLHTQYLSLIVNESFVILLQEWCDKLYGIVHMVTFLRMLVEYAREGSNNLFRTLWIFDYDWL